MFARFALITASAIFIATPAIAGPSSSLDDRMVGRFDGQRDMKRVNAKCPFLAWTFNRTADGRFDVTFYSNPERTRVFNKERGMWWVQGGKLHILTEGVKKPDIYRFKFRSNNTVDYTLASAGIVDPCSDTYRFSEQKL